ncbi:MAG: hypothetical protein A2X61_02730 [Ignavibacteria bacterium GWB2_35_12]|nr:MAG: hypothetical protein A2X63_11215 [Ignavibacteria bacterium GWA2_35_8]OGU42489.1 MAG: hypothetical protein A2X61_02730 [Ignavibacteria bacterium GWB2_35_12]OGU89893.1 MAG: hypothetical protein A2220_05890 [Ignavibacteria bacterium RIFOXYA2_FULL_35_10]OGV24269.1 MAG: hypothetical protein A2475_08655 [Ignavibacteria bacterium RIFOXYC2_FULL_35_21]
MKNISKLGIFLIAFAIILLFAAKIFAADNEKCSELKIKTSAYSWESKNIIESNLSGMLGVIDSDLDLKTKILTVRINSEKTNCDSIIKSIRKLGYEAEQVCSEVKDNNGADKTEKEGEKVHDCLE